MPQFKNTARPVALLAHMRKFLLKMSITDFYVDFIFVEYLSDKVLIFCLCGSFGGNSLLIWTNLTYDSNSAIQGDCQLLLKLSITGFLCTHICWIFMLQGLDLLCGSFGINSLLISTTLTYNSNSAIQGVCQLLLKISIIGLYVYCIFV